MPFFMPWKIQANFMAPPVNRRFSRVGGRQNSPRLIKFSRNGREEVFYPWHGKIPELERPWIKF
jgi:hypothetical protein